MNKLIYELTINDWYLKDIERNYSDDENCYNFYHQKLKGTQLDIFVDKETNKPTKWELWISRFNHTGIWNNIDEIYTYEDYKQLLNQLTYFMKTYEKLLNEVKTILEPFNIPMAENKLTYDGKTGLDLKDIEEFEK